MHELTLYYSVSNGGDGSAYPQFTTSKEISEIHQAMVNLGEGWGEPCTGSIKLVSESEIKVADVRGLIDVKDLKESLEYFATSDSSYHRSDAKREAKKLLEQLEQITI